ncbi:MAG: hypothetical protein Q8R39_00740 [bacterium]|nr:hypothetical protein [bacterium]MDZ4285276.1 hypothetical protein [Patescibacteria group bacterium]
MKGSPLTIVIIATVVIIGGSIVTYLLIENAPQEGGFDATNPQGRRTPEKRVPRPNVYEDTEPLALPSLADPEGGSSYASGQSATSSSQNSSQEASQKTKPVQMPQTTQTTGGEIIKPLPSLQDPD